MSKVLFVCLFSTVALFGAFQQSAKAEGTTKPLSLDEQNSALREEIAVLKRDASEREARQKVAELLIADLKSKLAKSQAESDAKVQAAVGEEQKRSSAYMAETDARIASIKSNFALIQQDVVAVSRTSRMAMARAIIKSRSHRLALRTVAALRSELGETKVAGSQIIVESGEMKTTSAIDSSPKKVTRKPRVVDRAAKSETTGFQFSFSP